MREQRRGTSSRSRRRFLRGAGVAAGCAVAGCLGGGGSQPVTILAAGSLQHALESGLEPAVDVPLQLESHGSATVARLVANGQRDPDIVTVADTALFEAPLSPDWHAVFASNAIVLAYNPDTAGGQRIEAVDRDRWYEPLVAGDVRLGRTDPDQDPLGYRTLFMLELAARYYDDAPDLREQLPDREQIYPETALLSQFETGAIDAAVAYRNMAIERGYDYVDLPTEIDLSDPAHADDWYTTVAYELPSGRVVRGDLISYGSTTRRASDTVRSVFDTHITGSYLDDSGFVRRDQSPQYVGDVPAALASGTRGRERS